jgi:tetratricopeptide (TPR) repeat protein
MADDLVSTRDALLKELARDTTQFMMYQEVGKAYYYLDDYNNAYKYYRKFVDFRELYQIDIFRHEDLKIGIVMDKIGRKEEGEKFIEGFRQWAEKDKTIYKGLHLATYYGYRGNKEEALRQLEEFSKQDNFLYWVTLLRDEPSMKSIEGTQKFQELIEVMRNKFQRQHDKVTIMLEEEGVI